MVDYDTYSEVSKQASLDDNIFNNFKQNISYTYMLEQHWPGTEHIGTLFYSKLEEKYKQLFIDLPWEKYQENDTVGGARVIEQPSLKKYVPNLPHYYFSHTTLRYILTSLNVISHLQKKYEQNTLSKIDIVEIGGGYGGQCKIMIDTLLYYNPEIEYTYTIIDLEEPSLLQRKYLDRLEVKNVTCSICTDYEKNKEYDLCISTYTIGEIPIEFQNEYVETIIKHCESAYFLWNVTPIPPSIENRSIVRPESPLLTTNNKTVTF